MDDTGHGHAGKYAACVQLGQKGPIRNDSDTAGFFGKPGCWMTYRPSTSYAGAYSAEAWVKPGSASKHYQTIFDTRGPNGEYSFDLTLEGSAHPGAQQLHMDVGDGQNWLTTQYGVTFPFAFTAGHWYYIAATVNARYDCRSLQGRRLRPQRHRPCPRQRLLPRGRVLHGGRRV